LPTQAFNGELHRKEDGVKSKLLRSSSWVEKYVGAEVAEDTGNHIYDMAVRHGGGTNVHMGIGSQYANAKYKRPLSTGDRIALEIKRAREKGKLDKIVT
jgi:hypothetical protein